MHVRYHRWVRLNIAAIAVAALALSGCAATGSTTTSHPSAAPDSGAAASAQQEAGDTASRASSPTTSPPMTTTAPTGHSGAPITVVAPPEDSASALTTAVSTAASTSSGLPSTASSATTPGSESTADSPDAPASGAQPATDEPATTRSLSHLNVDVPAGMVVVIDPGHNGENAAHPEIIHQQVPAGFGKHKNCNTTGTATNGGYPEHLFNWKVAVILQSILQAHGVTAIMTRDSDDGVGPCVNKRAAIGNASYGGKHADAVVSIHGDGGAASVHGFFVMTASRPPAGPTIDAQTMELAKDIRAGLLSAGFPTSNGPGTDGIWPRDTLAGLNLSKRPTVMLECGNMRNSGDAALMTSAEGQQRYAKGIAAGVFTFLNG